MALAIAARPPDFSIVLPARNEVANIAPMVAALREVMAPLGRFEIIYVDDGSDDGTLAMLREAAAADASPAGPIWLVDFLWCPYITPSRSSDSDGDRSCGSACNAGDHRPQT